MGDLAGVGIEPDEQTELIDATELLPGYLLTHSPTYSLTDLPTHSRLLSHGLLTTLPSSLPYLFIELIYLLTHIKQVYYALVYQVLAVSTPYSH